MVSKTCLQGITTPRVGPRVSGHPGRTLQDMSDSLQCDRSWFAAERRQAEQLDRLAQRRAAE